MPAGPNSLSHRQRRASSLAQRGMRFPARPCNLLNQIVFTLFSTFCRQSPLGRVRDDSLDGKGWG